MSVTCDIGVCGLATMGQNLALNFERRGYAVAVFNRTFDRTHEFLVGRAGGKRICGARTLEDLVASLAAPRRVLLMVKAGVAVDEIVQKLLARLSPGDMIVDGGNSHPRDTERRTDLVESHGLRYCGMGISGGEAGALYGPSIMPGCSREAWPLIEGPFQAIAAKAGPEPCCLWLGPRSAGHYTKMVHNGIEYVIMQALGDAYWLLRNVLGLANAQVADVFDRWNRTAVAGYLLEIARDALSAKDDLGDGSLVDHIKDAAKAKGTGKWTSQLAMDAGVPSSLVSEAVHARDLSAAKAARVRAGQVLPGPVLHAYEGDADELIESVRHALHATMICAYAQGFVQLQAAAAENHWPTSMPTVASIWRKGCIIQAKMLERIMEAFASGGELENLLLAPYFVDALGQAQAAWRRVAKTAIDFGLPVPALAAALTYYDSYRSGRLPANLLQAMRDYFGAHGYERTDRPGDFHFPWPLPEQPGSEPTDAASGTTGERS